MGAFGAMVGNSVTIICFLLLAIHFNNPYLILFAIFFYRNYYAPIKNEKKGETNE